MPHHQRAPTYKHFTLIISLIAGVGFFDFMLFMALADVLAELFFINTQIVWMYNLQIIGVYTVAFLASPLGGYLLGRFGDRQSRQGTLFISLLGMGVFTFIIGLLPSAQKIGIFAPLLLMLARLGQGMAFGGLLPACWVFTCEHLPRSNQGLAIGYVMASCLAALLALSILALQLQSSLTQAQILAYGWRILFLVGGLATCLLVFSIHHFKKTPIFNKSTITHTKPTLSSCLTTDIATPTLTDPPTKSESNSTGLTYKLFATKRYTGIIPAFVLAWMLSSLIIVICILLPNLIHLSYVLPVVSLSSGQQLSLVFMMFGCVFYGYIINRVNVGKVIIASSIIFIITLLLFFGHLKSGGELILVFFALLGFASGMITTAPIAMVRLFPVQVRLTNVALSFNISYALIGGLLPFILGYASVYLRLAPALYLMLVMVATIFISIYTYHSSHHRLASTLHHDEHF